MYYVYIIQGLSSGNYYIGSCKDWKERLKRHNLGFVRSTRSKGPYKLVHLEQFNTRSKAYNRERQIKRYKGGNAFKKLLNKL